MNLLTTDHFDRYENLERNSYTKGAPKKHVRFALDNPMQHVNKGKNKEYVATEDLQQDQL